MIGVVGLLIFFLNLAGPSRADDLEPAEPVPEYSGMSPVLCLGCHGPDGMKPAAGILEHPMAVTGNPMSPFGEGNRACESCHGPSKDHAMSGGQKPPGVKFNAQTPAEEKNASCLACHGKARTHFNWPGAVHNIEQVACSDCHNVHVANDPILQRDSESESCYGCHQEQRAQFLRQSRHPVQASSKAYSHTGLMSCTDCHNPHGGNGPAALKRNTVNESCYDCHAEKRGPFLWEHQPVSEDCSSCHNPHGSNYPNLLTGRTPWLCQQCHLAANHPSTPISGVDLPPGAIDSRIAGKNCLNCHGSIHGSNHPSGVALTR
jgi:DmsE family decaheme c-type cytochrome